ncbi:MAG: 16S rRNA (guanine(966)-N(2))-methyltransferase RsmD [FCB group bacterium]|nr:16S rRNA (guanine(966)-N(2))-methyltransferase RsmD [FCB group bacterium]
MLRVTGGLFRGMNLHCPKDIRPSSGRIKEYIFSQITEFVPGSRVLDIFAGSGALGIEALSRKARSAVFVEKSQRSITSIRKNLQKLEIQSKVIKADALRYIKHFKSEPFDIIFIDPPYRDYEPITLLEAVENSVILQNGGHLVMEMSTGTAEPETQVLIPNSFRALGDTTVGIWFRPG